MKKVLRSLILLAFLSCLFALPVNAADPKIVPPAAVWADGGISEGGNHVCFNKWIEGGKVISAKSSNPKILKITNVQKGGDVNYSVYFEGVKPGKAQLTVVYKLNGRKYTAKATYIVKPYPKVFRFFKVNGEDVDFKAYPGDYYFAPPKSKKITIRYKLTNGWKVCRIEGGWYDGKKETYFKPKNGKSFAYKPRMTFVNYEFRKGKYVFMYSLSCRKPGT